MRASLAVGRLALLAALLCAGSARGHIVYGGPTVQTVQRRWGEGAELTLHLESLLDGWDPRVGQTAAGIRSCVVATVGVDFETRRESVRIALPDGALAALRPRFDRKVARAGEHPLELVERYRDLVAFAGVELAGSIGRAKLTKAELRACVPGDVFVPEALTVAVEGGALKGTVELRVVGGRGGARVRCALAELTPGRVRVQVASVEGAAHRRSEAKKVPDEPPPLGSE